MAPLPRTTLQQLALAKARDARLLFEHGRNSNSYYLYGYAVELGLKACIARLIEAETVPDRAVLTGFMTHRLADLVGLAGLSQRLAERRRDRAFDSRWAVVVEWSEGARYELFDSVVASAMHDAVENAESGVLAWLKQYW